MPSVPAIIAYVDASETYRFANHAYESLFGLDPKRMIGHTMREVLGEKYSEAKPHIDATLAGRRTAALPGLALGLAGASILVLGHVRPEVLQGLRDVRRLGGQDAVLLVDDVFLRQDMDDFAVERDGNGPRGVPTVDGNRIYVLSNAGFLYALDLR